MPMAIIVQCHTNSEQINRLINFFYDEEIDIYLHIDKKSSIESNIRKNKNVVIVKDPIDVRWGNFSQVQATLKAFYAIQASNKYYSYIHLISGQDYPIKSLKSFKGFFDNNQNEYVENVCLPSECFIKSGRDRHEVYYPNWMIDRPTFKCKRIIRVAYRNFILSTKIFKRKLSLVEDVYCGSQWFSITGKCLEYILNYLKRTEKYIKFFQNTIYADEMFFQTLIMNSPFKNKVENNNLRYIDFSEKKSSPQVFNIESIREVMLSNNYFARKIEDMEVIDFIEQSLK